MTTTPDTPTTSTRRGRRGLMIGAALAAVVLVGLVIWYVGRDAPAAVDTQAAVDAAGSGTADQDADDGADESGDGDADAGDDAGEDTAATPEDGALPADWQIVTDAVEYDLAEGTGTFIGFRIAEELTTVGDTEAVGRTPAVEGTVTLEDTTLVDAMIVGDLTELTTDIRQRDGA